MLENLNQYANEPSGPNTCKVRSIRGTLDEDDKTRLDVALANTQGFSTNSLYQGLNNLGIKIGYNSLSRHRKKLCSCERNNA